MLSYLIIQVITKTILKLRKMTGKNSEHENDIIIVGEA